MNDLQSPLSRRQTLQIMAVLGLSGSAAGELFAKEPAKISPQTLQVASALTDPGLGNQQLDVAARALERNLYQFQIVRELEIDDLIEPAPIFLAGWR